MRQTERKSTGSLPRTILTAIFSSVLIAGCGSGSGSTDEVPLGSAIEDVANESIRKVGFATFSQIKFSGATTGGAADPETVNGAVGWFVESTDVLDVEDLESFLDIPTVQECYVDVYDFNANMETDGSNIFFDDPAPFNDDPTQFNDDISTSQLLSAGEVIPVTGPSGTLYNLVRESNVPVDEAIYFSDTDASITEKVTSGAFVDIPGEQFPAFSNVVIPEVMEFSSVSIPADESENFDSDSVIRWDANADSGVNNVMGVYVYAELVDPITGDYVDIYIDCFLEDDGEFSFPEDARQVFIDYDIPASSISLFRANARFETKGDSLLFVSNYTEHYR